ncbi:hypothetical protein BLOT_008943 [Blomia tropicalis]|nr:hypothetical protein BLOT_008943 [Blomia tropicalis]
MNDCPIGECASLGVHNGQCNERCLVQMDSNSITFRCKHIDNWLVQTDINSFNSASLPVVVVYAMTVDQLCPRPRSFIPFYSRLLINLANDVALYTDCVPYARSTMILLVAMQPTIYCRFLVTDNGLHICTLFILLCFTRINLGVNKLPLGLYVALI